MTKEQFAAAKAAMQTYMPQDVHDTGHVMRVLYAAVRIAKTLPGANMDVVILAALLHDIGRGAEDDAQKTGHAELGAHMAYGWLQKQGYSEETAAHVQACIRTHSYKGGQRPQSLEAEIVFDADKLDLSGAVGCGRALLFGAQIGEPWYRTGPDGQPCPGEKGRHSLLREYHRKLKDLHNVFFTQKARQMAKKRQETMDAWFQALEKEIYTGYNKGEKILEEVLG